MREAPQGGASAGTLVGSRAHIGMLEADDFEPHDVHPRFQLQKVGAICKGGIHMGSLYLQDCVGPTHPANIDILDHVARRLSALAGPWIIGGDFNCEPEELINTGFVDLVGGVVHAPADVTCGGKRYDYFVVSSDLSPAIFSVNAVADGSFSPHCPVRMLIRATPRAMLVRHLKAPRGFSARLPFGPPTLDHVKEAATANALFKSEVVEQSIARVHFPEFLDLIDSQLTRVAGLDEAQAVKHKGRTRGPSLVWRCAIDSAGIHRRCAAFRAWSASQKWLDTLMDLNKGVTDTRAVVGVHQLRRAISGHDHLSGNSAEADEFRRWQRRITPAMLCHQHWIRALSEVAGHKAKALAQRARNSSRNAWISWLQEGPAAGLGRQHRMSRTAIGWIPNPAHKGMVMEEDYDGHETCEQALTGEVKVHSCPTKLTWDQSGTVGDSTDIVPCSSQQHVDGEAKQWSEHWACQADMPACQWPSDMGPLPPMLELELLKHALSTFPEGLGLGWDGIHPRCLLRLGDSVLLALLRLLFLCEATGEWPALTTAVIVALLPKSSPGLRPSASSRGCRRSG